MKRKSKKRLNRESIKTGWGSKSKHRYKKIACKQKRPDPVMVGVIRRMLPSMIASSIVGVQPMTAPSGNIFDFKVRYNKHYGKKYRNRTKGRR